MQRLILATCLALAATLVLAAASHAHKVNIFAYVDGDTVVSDSGYSRTKRVQGGTVEVLDAATGQVLLTGTTDKDGLFAFPIPAKAREGHMDLLLRLKAGEGHQTEWTVKYAEYGSADAAPSAIEAAEPVEAAPAKVTAPMSGGVGVAEVEAVVRKELAPVKRMLADMNQSGPTVSDIMAGIGYIFGLFGVAAYMKSLKSS